MFFRSSPLRTRDRAAGLEAPAGSPAKARSQFSSPARGDDSSVHSATPPALVSSNQASDVGRPLVEDRFCGTIRFMDIPVALNAPTDLICEECEKATAGFHCASCKQVFCRKCVDICHPRICADELMHEHEKNGWIRPLQHGDTSRVKKAEDAFLPDTLCYVEDLQRIRDVSKGGSLCAGVRPPDTKGTLVKSPPAFRAGDLVLFPDPTTRAEAYGRVISEWEQIHTEAAPAIVRGDGSGVFYYVQMLGMSKDIGDPEVFAQTYRTRQPASQGTTEAAQTATEIGGGFLEAEPLMEERRQGREIDRKIREARGIQVLGPKFHLRDVQDRAALVPPDAAAPPGFLAQGARGQRLGQHVGATAQLHYEDRLALHYQQEGRARWERGVDFDLYAGVDAQTEPSLPLLSAHRQPLPALARSHLDYLQASALAVKTEVLQAAALQIVILPETEVTSINERILRLRERKEGIMRKVFIQRGAVVTKGVVKRRFLFWKNSMAELRLRQRNFCARKIQAVARVWLCRNKLEECRDYWGEVNEQKRQEVHAQFRYSSVDDPYAVTFDRELYFTTRADMNRYAHFLRVMLNRTVKFLTRKKDALLRKTLAVWKGAVYDFTEETLQNNHIDESLPMVEGKTFAQAREEIVAQHYRLLQGGGAETGAFDEMQHERISALPLRPAPLPAFFKAHDMAVPRLRQPGAEGDDWTVETVGTLDEKARSQWEQVPRYQEPAVLPELLPVQPPRTFVDRLYHSVAVDGGGAKGAKGTRKAAVARGDEAWRHTAEGPTSASFWLIPGLLLVGQAPYGVAERSSMLVLPSGADAAVAVAAAAAERLAAGGGDIALTAISALLLNGVDTFVSLLSEAEEALLETLHGTPPIQRQIEESLRATRANANSVVCAHQETIARQERVLAEIPNYGKTDPRYPAAYRQRLRCEARMQLAQSSIARIRAQVVGLPPAVSWTRLGHLAERKVQWGIDDVLPSLWQLEDLVRRGRRCFIYSLGAHLRNRHVQANAHVLAQQTYYSPQVNQGVKNRDLVAVDDSAGLLAAMALGRLYHATPYETMFRWQKAHDTMRALDNLPNIATGLGGEYRLSCPGLPWQKSLLVQVLRQAHFPLEYPVVRSQSDPETFTDLHRDGYDETLRNQTVASYVTPLARDATASSSITDAAGSIASSLAAPSAQSEGRRSVEADVEVVTPRSLERQAREAERQEDIMAGGRRRWKQSLYFESTVQS